MTEPRRLEPRRVARNALAVLTDTPWAILPNALETMVSIARRENPPAEAIEAERGEPLDHARSVTVRSGVARIPVDGPLFRRADLFARISGATSYDTLATDLTAALEDPAVRAIVLDVDSPGGEVAGCDELAGLIAAARGVKPISAYVSGHACSAAYWLASACDEVIVAPTAIVGSIGACIRYVDDTGAQERLGLRRIEIVSSQSPRKNRDPASEEGRSDVQQLLDSIAEVFVATVARNREVSVDTVLADFGQGGVLVGADAVAAGLADALGSYEDVVRELATDDAEGDELGDDIGMGSTRLVANATAGRQEAARGGSNTQATESEMAKRTLRAARRLMAGAGANGPGAADEERDDEDETTTAEDERDDEETEAEDDEEDEDESAAEGDDDEDERSAEEEEEEDEPAAANARERRLLAAGARLERQRLAAIDGIAIAGHSKLVARAKREGWSVAKASRRILAAEKTRQGDRLAAMREDMPKGQAPRGFMRSPSAAVGNSADETAEFILNAGRKSGTNAGK